MMKRIAIIFGTIAFICFFIELFTVVIELPIIVTKIAAIIGLSSMIIVGLIGIGAFVKEEW